MSVGCAEKGSTNGTCNQQTFFRMSGLGTGYNLKQRYFVHNFCRAMQSLNSMNERIGLLILLLRIGVSLKPPEKTQ